MRKVLVYNSVKETISLDVFTYFKKLNISYSIVNDTNLKTTIEHLLQEENHAITSSSQFPFSFILFANFTKEEVIECIKVMQANHYFFSHKAMLTANNIHWTLEILLKEIDEEEQFMISYRLCNELLKEANTLNYDEYEEASFIPYRDSFLKAYLYLQQGKVNKEMLDTLNQTMIKTRNQLIKK